MANRARVIQFLVSGDEQEVYNCSATALDRGWGALMVRDYLGGNRPQRCEGMHSPNFYSWGTREHQKSKGFH